MGRIADELRSAIPHAVVTVTKSRRKIGVSVPSAALRQCITSLVAHRLVHAVEHRPLYLPLNYYARWGTQGRPADREATIDLVSNVLDLSGLNEIVAVADTGMLLSRILVSIDGLVFGNG